MPNSISERIEELRQKADEKLDAEEHAVNKANWHQNVTARSTAKENSREAYREIGEQISQAESDASNSGETWQAFANAQLAYLELILSRPTQPLNRIAQLDGFSRSMSEQRKHLINARTPPELNEFIADADAASSCFEDILKNTSSYTGDALNFVSGGLKFGKYYDASIKLKAIESITSRITLEEGEDFVPPDLDTRSLSELKSAYPSQVKSVEEEFATRMSRLKLAMKFCKYAPLALTISTSVFEVLAAKGHWAEQAAKSAAAVTVGVVSTFSSAAEELASIFASLAAANAEDPPVEACLLASGVVVAVGIGVTELFDFLVDEIFGSDHVVPSMRLAVSASMYANMSSSMSSNMAASMLPHVG